MLTESEKQDLLDFQEIKNNLMYGWLPLYDWLPREDLGHGWMYVDSNETWVVEMIARLYDRK